MPCFDNQELSTLSIISKSSLANEVEKAIHLLINSFMYLTFTIKQVEMDASNETTGLTAYENEFLIQFNCF